MTKQNKSGSRRGAPNAGSFSVNRRNKEAGAPTRFKRKHPVPSLGDRFSELTVVGYRIGNAGGIWQILVACSCGAAPHYVYQYNLFKGRSTRCNVCAKKQAGHWRKNFWAYADIVPEDTHRRRLLNRISACFNRCHNPKDRGFPNYGARGVFVCELWRKNRRAFLAHLVSLDGWRDPSCEMDRINVDGGYEPGNLRFVSRKVNQGNRRQIKTMQQRIDELEARLRSCQCATSTVL